jgi:hypothetical protein
VAQRMRTDPCEADVVRGPSFERLEESLPRHRTAQTAYE